MSSIELRLSRLPDAQDESLETAYTLVDMLQHKVLISMDRMIVYAQI